MTLPLAGIRVLDLSSIIAAPVTATMLGDFGAEVVKVEDPIHGDFMRRGAREPGGRSLQWVQDARNKESVTLNLRHAEARAIVHRLLPHFDVVVTNFRPPTLRRWGFDPDTVRARHPRLIALYVTGYGLTGPYSDRGAFDRVASAFAGLTHVTGESDRPPVRSGYATIDYMGAYAGAFGVMTALYHRDCRGGSGQVIDLALYEPGFRASEDALLAYAATGRVRERSGNINPKVVPAGDFDTADGKRVTIHAGTQPLLRRLAELMNEPGLCDDPRFATHARRVENQDALYATIADWVSRQNLTDLMASLVAADIPASPLMSVADIAADPHFRERGTIMPVQDEDHGALLMAAPIPRLSETPGSVRSLGPRLGSANETIFGGLLAMSADEIARLRQAGTI
ncbi:MAG TPA: CoA transferase [Acetobacteraceae bacterium]|nr:CoA transferase [Acetobacteraceae bacterium]